MANPQLTELQNEVQNATTVEASATALINGIAQRVADAVQAAVANGATAEELQPVIDLGQQLRTQSNELQAAVVANTPAA